LFFSSAPTQRKRVIEPDALVYPSKNNPRLNVHSDRSELEATSVATDFNVELSQITSDITSNLNSFQLGLAADRLYDSFWHFFCDRAIEDAKSGALPHSDLVRGLTTYLKLFHPFLPFVTEAIWQEIAPLRSDSDDLIISQWPK
jgi:valyl-tRNA synthetase